MTKLWKMSRSVSYNLEGIKKDVFLANEFLQKMNSDPDADHYPIDEVALYFPNDAGDGFLFLVDYIRKAVKEEGVTHFNSAEDIVRTWPIQRTYDVDYDFLTTPDAGPRLELMRITDGYSPIHDGPYSPASIVHLSFKCHNEQHYDSTLEHLATAGQVALHCESTYGRFSYWAMPWFPMYLKPRVNLRDRKVGDE